MRRRDLLPRPNGGALCIHNGVTGCGATIRHVISRTEGPLRKVVVVGTDAAGLEAARVLAERDRKVTMLKASSQAGGQGAACCLETVSSRTDRHRRLAIGWAREG